MLTSYRITILIITEILTKYYEPVDNILRLNKYKN